MKRELYTSRREFIRRVSFGSLACAMGFHEAVGQIGTREEVQPVYLNTDSKGYDRARQLFNSRLNLKPKLIAVCQSESEVAAAVVRANAEKLQVTVKSGGHSFEGFCSNNGGLMLDLSEMKGLEYDVKTQMLTAQPGCKLGEVSDFLFPKGRLLPSGSCSGVGLAGIALGGGYGLFARKFGLTCDHLVGVRVVDGMGNIHDSKEHPDLLKVCRGGGNGNFGIITELRFRTVLAPKTFLSQRIKFRNLTPEEVAELAAEWFSATKKLPNDVFSAFVLNGKALTVLVTFFDGGSEGVVKSAFAGLVKRAWKNEAVHIAPTQKAIKRYYGRPGPLPFKNASAGFYKSYQDISKVMPMVARQVAKISGTVWQVNTLGGRINSRDYAADSVFPYRSYPWLGEIQGYWNKESRAEVCIKNVQEVQKILADAGVSAHYRNYPDIEFKDWERSYYGEEGLQLIQKVKGNLDPSDTIRHPQSVKAVKS